ncbi:FGGY-family carbohydrate kinase [Nonomuraea sp. NBC_01738]|uniref:FGGY-family carbohydrate kinase n=1 Tax=Nonomuraea sp. NBC_01738 TaxID=2976003 RepID=UPI002E0F3910|nr:FGGY-family carbohydrate kinase [Nonomuraea sp. NBC_01738]
MTFGHGPGHVARAVLEGLALVVRHCLETVRARPTELRVCGGGASSDPWTQIISDVTGLPVLRSADAEAGARGAYLIGARALGLEARPVEARDAFRPGADHDEQYERFTALRRAVSATWGKQ